MHINIINRLTITIVTRSQDHGLGELQVGEDAVGHLVAQRGEAGLDVAAARAGAQLSPDHLPTQLPQTQRVRRRVEQNRLTEMKFTVCTLYSENILLAPAVLAP